ncbi:MAG: transcription termination/antitermination NusG family protein, partial [Bryobacteraceae bacterium]
MPDAWFALGVRENTENSVAAALVARGFEAWHPTHRVTKLTEVPLFPGCVFARMREHDRRAVLTTPGVHSILGGASGAEPVRDESIRSLRILVAA